jgi:hypothetical protein
MAVNDEIANAVVAYLNELLEADRVAIAALVSNRVPCNAGLADHPTCQVQCQNGGTYVGLLGLLNGLCGVIDSGPYAGAGGIVSVFEPDDLMGGKVNRLARFERVKEQADG